MRPAPGGPIRRAGVPARIVGFLVLVWALGALACSPARPGPPGRTPVPEDPRGARIPSQSREVLESYLDPGRRGWQKTDQVLAALRIRPGDTVLDVGAGSGYFSWKLSPLVGPGGRVVALDIDPGAVALMEKRLAEDPPAEPNIFIFRTEPQDLGLEPQVADLAFLCEAHFPVDGGWEAKTCLESLHRALKPGGRVAVIEARNDPLRGEVSPERLARPFLEAGFRKVEQHDFLPRQQFLVLEKPR